MMRACQFDGEVLSLREVPIPTPSRGQILIKIDACGVCRTDLHIVDKELPHPKLPLILGHQIVGKVVEVGALSTKFKIGDRVGVPWLGYTCGECEFCKSGRENLCDLAEFTGYTVDGGYAEYVKAFEDYVFKLPENYSDLHVAPLLCAGLIGYRAWRSLGKARKVGFFGFGSSAHILVQVARFEEREVFAFTRKGDEESQKLAIKLGAVWAKSSEDPPPTLLDGAIIFAPVGPLMVQALKWVKKGGIVVSAGIHMSDIPSFPYELLWEERVLTSVANLTRQDGLDFLNLASKVQIHTEITTYPLEKAALALSDLKQGKSKGSFVLKI